ncbi:chitinase [Dissophora ornata]|nr:chitinase [Dissophora ornata]
MVVAYWTDWTSAAMPPEAIPFDKVTHINYAFSIVTPDFRPVFDTDYLLPRVVRAAHAKNVKVLMSIGGWTGSQYFSPLSASVQGRKTFIDGAVKMAKDFDLDGIDIDWEYPGRQGSACNVFDEQNDTKNFLILLNELRAALNTLPRGPNLQISLATRIVPFDGPDGQLQDVSAFSKVVNHINVMAYDINGSWGTETGANAPLTGPGSLTYKGGAQAWIDAGFPPQQINMGVPFYGRSLITKTDMTHAESMSAPFRKQVPLGDNNDGMWTDPCEKSAAYSGVWKFKNLREQGLIDVNGNARAPWVRRFDEDSQTPWLFNPETRQFISYDDRESLELKVEYAKKKDLGGVMLWALNQDSSDFELLNVLQRVRQ